MAVLLNIAFIISGLLLVPPALTIFTKGPIAGGEELIGAKNFAKADYESPLLVHLFWLDAGRNAVNVLLCFAAVFFFDLTSKRVAALLLLILDAWALCVQVLAPVGPDVKPWPALDGIFSNPVVLPIIGGQIGLLTVGLLTSMAMGGGSKAKPKKK